MTAVTLLPAFSLKSRIALATLFFIGVTALALTAGSSLVVQTGLDHVIGVQQTALAAQIAEDIDQKLAIRQNILSQLASSIPTEGRLDSATLRPYLNGHVALSPLFDNLAIIALDGHEIVNLNFPEARSMDPLRRSYFDLAIRTARGVIAVPVLSRLSRQPILVMYEPILDSQGAVRMVLMGNVFVEQGHLLGNMATLKVGKTGYVFLTGADGTYVMHEERDHILKNALDLPGDNRALKRILDGENGPFLAPDPRGVQGIFTTSQLKTTGWRVTTFLPATEAYAPVAAIARNGLYLALLLMLVIGPLAWWYTRRQIAPLQALRQRILLSRGGMGSPGETKAAAGNYANDEIGALARAHDTLAAENHAHQLALTEEKELLRVTLQSIGDAVITVDGDGRVTYLNPVAEQMTGWSSGEAKGLALPVVFDIVNDLTGEPVPDPVQAVLRSDSDGVQTLASHTILRERRGAHYAIEDSIAAIRNAAGAKIGAVLVFRDVTEAQKLASRMSHRASHDALTGLINRHEFERRLALAIDNANEHGHQHTLLYLDLDQFKIVNDSCGHEAGDELLRQLTALMQTRLRKSDTLARLGGDEFAVLLEGSPTKPAEGVADGLRRAVKDFSFTWDNKIFAVGVSIGLVAINGRAASLHELLAMADTACYIAKDKGRDQVHIYDEAERDWAGPFRDGGWTERIRHALDENRLTLFAQKIVVLQSGDAAGEPGGLDRQREAAQYELLLRMRESSGLLLAPMAFIPAAERFGLMPEIDRWVINSALAGIVLADGNGSSAPVYAINLSAASICDEQFLPFLRGALALAGVAPGRICFEISETSAITHLSKVTLLMHELKAIGCLLALDDFCSGVSSFTSVRHLPIDYLKLDGTIVKEILDDPVKSAMLTAIRHVSKTIGHQLVAEQVENPALLPQLHAIGVDYIQGYVVGTPAPWRPGKRIAAGTPASP